MIPKTNLSVTGTNKNVNGTDTNSSNREHDDANPGLSKGQRLVLHILRMAYAGSSVTRVPSDQMRQRWDLYRHWDLYEQRHY